MLRPGLQLEIIKLPGRTPVLFFEIPAAGSAGKDTVLMYGHIDKQPEFSGWRAGYGPWTPKYVDDKLYGRGGADDGYAVYASLTAIQDSLDRQTRLRITERTDFGTHYAEPLRIWRDRKRESSGSPAVAAAPRSTKQR